MKIQAYDNGGKTLDRFTILFSDDPAFAPTRAGHLPGLAASEQPFHPQGFGQHIEAAPGRHLEKRIAFFDLPADVRRFVARELTEACS